jgi:F-type H+-transporting ATPase subunit a
MNGAEVGAQLGTDLIEPSHLWSLSPLIGYNHPLLSVNSETVMYTWAVIGIVVLLLMATHYLLHYTKIGRFIILSFVTFFIDLTKQALGAPHFSHCVFAASLFIFIALCNTASLIPWLDEPTKDLNTALALGILSFIYIQIITIKTNGIKSYIKDLFKPFFIMFPLNIIGKLSSIISISFRLFGNIFGGSVITKIYFGLIYGSLIGELLGILTGANFIIIGFFTLFEGLLQAFVFAMLTLTYLSIGMQEGGGH